MSTATTDRPGPPNPIDLLRELIPEQVIARLAVIEAERKGLLALLRSLQARQRAAARAKGGSRGR
jgi:hypothetical protein